MPDFDHAIRVHKSVSDDAAKQAGKATGDDMDAKHKQFLAALIAKIDRREIDASVPSSLIKQDLYARLPEEARSAIDYAALNLADQLRQVEWYFRSTTTPNASPQLQTMIEHLWNMKQRLTEKHGDVLKF